MAATRPWCHRGDRLARIPAALHLHVSAATEELLSMRCYFYAHKPGPPETPGNGMVSFCLPELDITFRARYRGTAASCEYAALLALLEFVDINPKLFEGRTLEVFGDSFTVVNQVNERLFCRKDLEPFRSKAVGFRNKVPYVLNYVPTRENPAQGQITPE